MFSYIKGTVKEIGERHIVLECNDIGFFIQTSRETSMDVEVLDEVTIYTHFVSNDNGVFLYGFSKKEELDMYKLLLKVSSIGPQNALSILSTLSVNRIKLSILNNDLKTLQKAPGIGKKTAGKIVIELTDRIDKNDVILDEDESLTRIVKNNENYEVARDALINLGYTRHEVIKVLDKIDMEGLSLEEIIKISLSKLS